MSFIDTSKQKFGQQDLPNWLGSLKEIGSEWSNKNFNDDAMRILLKKTLFKNSASWQFIGIHTADINYCTENLTF